MRSKYLTGEQTRQTILKESKALFYEKGYHQTTYSHISVAANVNRALIPYHFQSKQILGLEIYHEIINEFFALIDNLLDVSQFDEDFVNALHMVTYFRLLKNQPPFLQFLSELQEDGTISPFSLEEECQWLIKLGDKFQKLDNPTLTLLAQLHIGMQKESIILLRDTTHTFTPDTVSKMHLALLMHYAGYSTKKIDELWNGAIEVANLLNFQMKENFALELKYN